MTPRDPKHFAFIDAVRGFAFLAVLALHSVLCVGNFSLSDLLKNGGYGVQLFFLASAITLCHSMSARAEIDKYPVLAFYIRRLFRIAPMFWLAMAVYGLLPGVLPEFWRTAFAPDGVDSSSFALTALFLHGWYPSTFNSIVPGGWSIAVEMTFYSVFPLMFRYLNSLKSAAIAVASVIVWLKLELIFAAYLRTGVYAGFGADLMRFFLGKWFPAQIGVFVVGIFTYHFLRSPYGRALGASRFWATGIFLLCLVALPGLFNIKDGHGGIPWPLTTVAILAVIIVTISSNRVPGIINPIICYIGKISYSCYLVHFAMMGITLKILGYHLTKEQPFHETGHGLTNLLSFLAIYGISLLLTITAATLTLHLVEKPGIALGRKFLKWIDSREGRSRQPVAMPSQPIMEMSQEGRTGGI